MKRLLVGIFIAFVETAAFAQVGGPGTVIVGGGGTGGSSGPATALQSPVVIEGTADDFEGNFTFADPTADWTAAWDAAGVLALPNDMQVPNGKCFGGAGDKFCTHSSLNLIDGYLNNTFRLRFTSSGYLSLDGSYQFGFWSGSGSGDNDTGIARSAAGIIALTDGSTGAGALKLRAKATAPRTCDATGAGDLYYDTSLALCFCDGTAWQVLNPLTAGVGTCS